MAKSNKPNPFKPLVKKVPKTFRNRYWVVAILLAFWLFFVDKSSFITQFRLSNTITRLENDRKHYKDAYQQTLQEKQDMENDKEKFAREHYFMKSSDEDVFIIESADKKINK
jgi:hypothetical protein